MFAHRSGKSEGTSVMPTPTEGSFKSEAAADVDKKIKKQSVADKLYNNFKKNEFRRGMSSRSDASHLDTDATERRRQKDERKKEAHYERLLAGQRIEGYADLMAAKERFEFERQIVQKAEVRRFLCNIFLDIGVVMEEKRNEKGFFSAMTDYVTCSLGGFSNTDKAIKDGAKASAKAIKKSAKDPSSSSSSRRTSVAVPDGVASGPKNDESPQSACVLA